MISPAFLAFPCFSVRLCFCFSGFYVLVLLFRAFAAGVVLALYFCLFS